MNITDWVGAAGVFLILLAYLLSTINVLSNRSIAYIVLNLVGASLACLASLLINYIPFVILEGAWAMIALISLFRYKKVKV